MHCTENLMWGPRISRLTLGWKLRAANTDVGSLCSPDQHSFSAHLFWSNTRRAQQCWPWPLSEAPRLSDNIMALQYGNRDLPQSDANSVQSLIIYLDASGQECWTCDACVDLHPMLLGGSITWLWHSFSHDVVTYLLKPSQYHVPGSGLDNWSECAGCSVVSNSLQPQGLQPTRLLCSLGFSRQEYCSGLLFASPGDPPDPGIKPGSVTLQVDSLLSEPPGKNLLRVDIRFKNIYSSWWPLSSPLFQTLWLRLLNFHL